MPDNQTTNRRTGNPSYLSPALSDRIVVITGGGGLLGRAFAHAIAKEGGIPVIADHRLDAAKTVAQDLNEDLKLTCAFPLEMDICSRQSIQNGINAVIKKYGRIDALVNNAYPKNKNYGRHFESVEFEDFCENVNMHLGGYFLTTQEFCAYFKSRGCGNIVTISSIYGIVPPRFEIYENTDMTMPVEYSVIKAGLIHLNKYLVKYFKGSGIRFNCVSPGGVFNGQPQSFIDKYSSMSQGGGLLTPIALVGALTFLLSDESLHITGQNIVVDDGWSL